MQLHEQFKKCIALLILFMNWPRTNQQIHKNNFHQYQNYPMYNAMGFLAEVAHELSTQKFPFGLFIGHPNHITLHLLIDYNLPVPLPTIKFLFFAKHIFFLN